MITNPPIVQSSASYKEAAVKKKESLPDTEDSEGAAYQNKAEVSDRTANEETASFLNETAEIVLPAGQLFRGAGLIAAVIIGVFRHH